jgi:uncharacterized membrane protein (DUF485 family)
MSDATLARIRANPKFGELERTRSRFAWTLTIIMLVIYYGFIFVLAFDPAAMAVNVGGQITLGFPLGLFVILSAIVLTGIYVWRANGEFDRKTHEILREYGA